MEEGILLQISSFMFLSSIPQGTSTCLEGMVKFNVESAKQEASTHDCNTL